MKGKGTKLFQAKYCRNMASLSRGICSKLFSSLLGPDDASAQASCWDGKGSGLPWADLARD